jgi:sugar phosphate isomerase/epimerase
LTPLFSVIEFTTPRLSFAEDLDVYHRAGVDGIGITERKLGDGSPDVERLQDSGLIASSGFPAFANILPRPGDALAGVDHARRVEILAESIRKLARFDVPCCSVVPGPLGSYSRGAATELVVEACRSLAQVASDEGTKLALEVMHPSLDAEFSFVTSLPAATELLDDIGSDEVLLALDAWHLDEQEEALLEQVRECAHRVGVFHVNDRRVPTRSWCDRVLPGDGCLDLRGLLRSLEDGGFAGWFELEVVSDDGSVANDFPDSLWKQDPVELVSDGRAKFLSLWERRRTPVA